VIKPSKKIFKVNIATKMIFCAGLLCNFSNVQAEGSPWSVYAGVGNLQFDSAASVSVNGAPVAGGNASASNGSGLAFGILYALDPDWSAELALGLPLTTTLSGAGTLQAVGRLGDLDYGPAVLSVRRYLPPLGIFKTYIGAGVNYTMVLSNKDGAVQNLSAKSAWGSVAQIGFQVPLDSDWSVGLDIKKIWINTSATGSLPAFGGASVKADVRLDPLITKLALIRKF